MPIKGISISDTIVLSNSLSRLSSDFLKGGATGELVGRFVESANANRLLSRSANPETIQEPIRKPTTPTRRRREQLTQRTQRNAAQGFGHVDQKEKTTYLPFPASCPTRPATYTNGSQPTETMNGTDTLTMKWNKQDVKS